MWKEKLYTGTIAIGSDTVSITKLPSTSTVTVNISKTDTLNECIKSFLLECGVPSVIYYPCSGSDTRKGNLFINGVPFQFYVSGSYYYWNATFGSTLTIYSSSSSVIFDSSGNYSIRLCLAGNPTSSFGFMLAGSSTYGAATYALNYLMMYKLKSAIDDSIAWLVSLNRTYNFYFVAGTDFDTRISFNNSYGIIDILNLSVPTTIMELFANKYPLIPKYLAMYRMVDCYAYVSTPAIGSLYSTPADSKFVKIGTKTYFSNDYQYAGLLIDCG